MDQQKLRIWKLFTQLTIGMKWVRRKYTDHTKPRRSRLEVFCKKGVLTNFAKFTGKYLRQRLSFNKVVGFRPEACNFIKNESMAQAFSCEFCEISKNTFSHRTPLVASSKNGVFYTLLQFIALL